VNIINSATNAVLNQCQLPVGAYEWPTHGPIVVIAENWTAPTNLNVGAGDTLILWPSGYTVSQGVSVETWMGWGFALVFAGLMAAGGGRWIARVLSGRTSGL